MIKIIYDPQDSTSARENKVREISTYPQLVKSCLASLNKGKNLTIILAQPVLLHWFKNMSARYPQGTFVFEALDARLALAQRWGMAIPDSVAKEDILQGRNLRYWRRHGPSTTYNDITVLTNIKPERIPYAATNLCP